MAHHVLQGYVPAELLREPTVPPGISVQPLRVGTGPCTIALNCINLAKATHFRPDFTDLDPAILELGIPRTARYYAAIFLEPYGMQGYRFEIVGTTETPHDPPDAPRFLDQVNPESPTTIIAWRRRIRREGMPLYLEARWAPTIPVVTFAIHGVEPGLTLEHLSWTRDALAMLIETRAVRPPWRPRGTRVWRAEEWIAAAPAKWAEAQRRRGGAPVRNEDLMQVYGVTKSMFYRNCAEYGHPAKLGPPSPPTF